MARKATLQEIDTHWSVEDVLEANEAMDALEEAESTAQAMAEAKVDG